MNRLQAWLVAAAAARHMQPIKTNSQKGGREEAVRRKTGADEGIEKFSLIIIISIFNSGL